MKTIRTFLLFLLIFASLSPVFSQIGTGSGATDIINQLLSIQEPRPPIIQGNSVIFTADSGYRMVGIAFAHEDFKEVYWFTKLLIPQDRMNPVFLPGQTVPDPVKDSGIQFYVYELPEDLEAQNNKKNLPPNQLHYRLIINGLWTTDPAEYYDRKKIDDFLANSVRATVFSFPQSRRDPVSGLNLSFINLPARPVNLNPIRGLPDGLLFTFHGPPGEIVTVAGSFNAWDPFMFELREGPSGTYTLTLPLPPGTYQYAFFNRGQRLSDANNPRRAYARDGSAVSEIIVP